MSYIGKETFYMLKDRGADAGRPAVFLRFSGCNLWSGHLEDWAPAAFCDTDLARSDGVRGGKLASADDLAEATSFHLPSGVPSASVSLVCIGGEPLLQLWRLNLQTHKLIDLP